MDSEEMQSGPKPDPLDAEVYEVLHALGVIVLLHGLFLVMGLADSLFVLKGYIWIACCLLDPSLRQLCCGFQGAGIGGKSDFS